MSWKPTVVATEKERSSFAKIKDIQPDFLVFTYTQDSCFALFMFCMLLNLRASFDCDQPAQWRTLRQPKVCKRQLGVKLYFGLKRRTAVSRVMMALVLFHLALVLFSDFL